MDIRGRIEIDRSPSLKEQHDSEHREDSAHERKKYRIECLTLLAVMLYAGLTFWLLLVNRSQMKIARDTFNAASRPYVGMNGWTFTYYIGDKPFSQANLTPEIFKESTSFAFSAEIRNFGPVPGTNFVDTWKVFLDNEEIKQEAKIPELPGTIFPGQVKNLIGTMRGSDYIAIKDGKKILIAEVTISYNGPAGHYQECTKSQYAPAVANFFDLGPCPKP